MQLSRSKRAKVTRRNQNSNHNTHSIQGNFTPCNLRNSVDDELTFF